MQRGAQNIHRKSGKRFRCSNLKSIAQEGSSMAPNSNNFDQSCCDYSDRSPSPDGMFANRDSGVSRREFLGMTAATLLMAGRLSGSTKPETKNGIPYRTLGHTGEKVSVIGLGGYHLGKQSDPE